jgi:hypothetical protein
MKYSLAMSATAEDSASHPSSLMAMLIKRILLRLSNFDDVQEDVLFVAKRSVPAPHSSRSPDGDLSHRVEREGVLQGHRCTGKSYDRPCF